MPECIEWRISQVYKNGKARVLAYITSRAVMDRLDEVFGLSGWCDEYEFIGDNVVCRLSIKIGDAWITKVDGAPQTHIEAFKGGISDALKRAAVKFGVGRYLYDLPDKIVQIDPAYPQGADAIDAKYVSDNKTGVKGYWIPPQLPKWAIPYSAIEDINETLQADPVEEPAEVLPPKKRKKKKTQPASQETDRPLVTIPAQIEHTHEARVLVGQMCLVMTGCSDYENPTEEELRTASEYLEVATQWTDKTGNIRAGVKSPKDIGIYGDKPENKKAVWAVFYKIKEFYAGYVDIKNHDVEKYLPKVASSDKETGYNDREISLSPYQSDQFPEDGMEADNEPEQTDAG